MGGIYATIGPSRPYVIPSTLAQDDTVAVVGSITGPHDDTYYMIAYYAPKGLQPKLRPPSWGRRVVVWYDEEEERQLWTINNSRWDFDLEPYVDRGQLMWIPEGKDIPTGVGHSPFIGLPGNDRRQEIECCLKLDPEDYRNNSKHYEALGVKPRVTALSTTVREHYTPDGSNPNPFA